MKKTVNTSVKKSKKAGSSWVMRKAKPGEVIPAVIYDSPKTSFMGYGVYLCKHPTMENRALISNPYGKIIIGYQCGDPLKDKEIDVVVSRI